jgi:predicted enzyme related to lactoylglutathione lyase
MLRMNGTWCWSTANRGLSVQLAPDHVPPDWPDGAPQQIHLDLWVDDVEAAHEEVMSLGASLLKAAADSGAADNYQVYADPAGHPFCLCWVKAG